MSLSEDAPQRYIPTPQHCIGREAEIAALSEVLTKSRKAQVALYGGPGVGKSTLGLAVLATEVAKLAFGNAIFYIRCDGLRDYQGFLRTLAFDFEIAGQDRVAALAASILNAVKKEPCLLFLDNAEVPLTCGEAHLVEKFIHDLSQAPSLTLLVSARSNVPPLQGHLWDLALPVRPLDPKASQQVFSAYAGQRFDHEPELAEILKQMGGVPLAIKLLALRTRHEDSIQRTCKLWRTKGTDVLLDRTGDLREASLEAALTVSLDHEWMKQDERTALAAVAFFPKGVARALLEKERYAGIGEALPILLDLGLLERAGQTLYLLPPVRDYVKRHLSLPETVADSLAISCWQWMEARCKQVGSPRGSAAIAELVFFAPNFEAALLHGLQSRVWKSACSALSRYAAAGKIGMFGSALVCEAAIHRVQQEAMLQQPHDDMLHMRKAWVLRAAAQQYERAGDVTVATNRYSDALNAIADLQSREADDLRTHLTKDLAHVALQSGALDEAAKLYRAAEMRFRDLKDARDEIECSLGLVEVAFRQATSGDQELIQKVDQVIAQVSKQTKSADVGDKRTYRVDFERTEAKAYALKSRITASIDHDLALNCSIKALLGFSAAADVAATVEVVNQMTALFLSSRDAARSVNHVITKLAGNPQRQSHRARARWFSFLFNRVARQSASSTVASIYSELAGRLKEHGLPLPQHG